VAIPTGLVEHLSVRPDLVPLCNQRSVTWRYFEVSSPGLPLCGNCAGVLRRLSQLAGAA